MGYLRRSDGRKIQPGTSGGSLTWVPWTGFMTLRDRAPRMRQTFEESPEEEWRNVEREFWARHQRKCGSASQYKPLLNALVQRIRMMAVEQHLDVWTYETKLREAEDVLEDVTFALKANWNDAPDGKFWYGFDLSQLAKRPECWNDASPINPSLLDAATAHYLERPWLQVNRLDWYIINGFLSDEILRAMEAIKSGAATGQINFAYLLSGGKYFGTIYWRVGLGFAKFVASWILLPAIAGFAYYLGHNDAAKWILVLFGILVVLRIILLPSRLVRRRARRRKAAEWEDKLMRLTQIKQSCEANTLNPTRLRERIAEAERGETLVSPAVYSILDRAIARDTAVSTISG